MVHYKPQEYDIRELSEQDSVCVYALCNDSEMRLTTQTAMLRHACLQQYGNTIEYMYQTCSKCIICLVLVISVYATMQCNEIANHTKYF